MEARELRIGNLVNHRYYPASKVTALLETQAEILHNNRYYFRDYTDIVPIPLTEDWLVKFGFEYVEFKYSVADMWQGMGYWFKNKGGFEMVTLRGGKDCKNLKIDGFINSKIDSVHQLQNLYYALINKELTQKLK